MIENTQCCKDRLTEYITRLFFIWIGMMITVSGIAQDSLFFKPGTTRREMKAMKIKGTIKIDGVLSEAEWGLAPPFSDFRQIEPYQGKPASYATVIKILYDQKYLYCGIVCKDPMGKKAIMATDFARDFDNTKHD